MTEQKQHERLLYNIKSINMTLSLNYLYYLSNDKLRDIYNTIKKNRKGVRKYESTNRNI